MKHKKEEIARLGRGKETRSCKTFPPERKYFFIHSENSINSRHLTHCSHFSCLCGAEILRNSKYRNSVRCRGWRYQRMTCSVCNAYYIRSKKTMINIRTCNTKTSQGLAFFATRSSLRYIFTFSLLTIKLGIAIIVSWFCSPLRRRNWRNVLMALLVIISGRLIIYSGQLIYSSKHNQ